MTPDESTLDKIQKLLALADRAGTPAEAENAMRKAQTLMIRHQLDEESVRLHAGSRSKGEPIITIRHPFGKMIGRDRYISLFSVIARAMSCRVWYVDAGIDYAGGSTGSVTVCGHKSDAEFASLLWKHLVAQCSNAISPEWKRAKQQGFIDCECDGGRVERFMQLDVIKVSMGEGDCIICRGRGLLPLPSAQAFRLGFIDGFVRVAGGRVRSTYAAEVEASESTALVLRGRKDRVDDHVDENFNITTDRKGWTRHSPHGAGAGRSAGSRADVTLGSRGVTSSTKGTLNA